METTTTETIIIQSNITCTPTQNHPLLLILKDSNTILYVILCVTCCIITTDSHE